MVTLETIALLIFYTLHQIFSFFGTCKTTLYLVQKYLQVMPSTPLLRYQGSVLEYSRGPLMITCQSESSISGVVLVNFNPEFVVLMYRFYNFDWRETKR